MAPSRGKACKDCGPASKRAAPYPGPRCATHHREKRKRDKKTAHHRWIKKTYGITGEQYEALLEAQGGTCYICRRSNGKSKRLAVDHDHRDGFVRGLLCGPCNSMLAWIRDDVDTALRLLDYLGNPPAHDIVGRIKAE